uniref:Replication factor A C-terminal domain-containing protein n=1 Tax=Lactuca sativa TaxID=4236 RepID=A0A9R1VG30_LACSA|nr:hypothetical protein LSAT_V11C500274380 [Lactuca sativa]
MMHTVNFYKTTTVRVSTPFIDMIDPFNLVTFQDLTAINFDPRVAMKIQVALWDGFVLKLNNYILEHQNDNALVIILLCMGKLKTWGGQPQVGNCLFGSRLHINDDMPHILEFKKAIADINLNFVHTVIGFVLDENWYLLYCRDCSKKVNKNDDDSNVEPFNCDGCNGISNVYDKVRVILRVQDETGYASFVLFDRHVKDDQGHQNIHDEFNSFLNRKFISKFNLQNNYLAYTIHKMSDDEGVVGVVFKSSPAYEQNNIHSDGTPINKRVTDKSVSVDGDNIDVVDLDAVTPTTTSVKRPTEIVTTTKYFK